MSTPATPDRMLDVPTQIFERFLQSLHEAGASAELVDALRSVLLRDKKYTERALKEAVLGAEQQ